MKVYLNDVNLTYNDAHHRFCEAAIWARENCSSYYGIDIVDVSDFAANYDTVAEYRFYHEQDATLFALRWA